jgi:hypothetical protein
MIWRRMLKISDRRNTINCGDYSIWTK